MKRIIYSIVAALILSIILALFIPRWFFKGDARWTYQNDAARVDVSFRGHLKNGRVGAEGSDLRVTQPAWLSNESYQGTVVEFPVSYRKCTYQIKLTPQAEEIGQDAVLVVELKGSDFQHRGKRRPAWITLQNIAVNGQSVAGKEKVWHDKPFILTYPLGASELTLTFDVHKPFKAATDFSFVRFSVLFLAFLMFFLFFTQTKSVACRAPRFIGEKDMVKAILAGYRRIDPVYRRSFWVIFGVLCFAFGFHTICFMWGNHDWSFLNSQHRCPGQAWQGRYMKYSVKVLLSSGVYLPLIYDLIVFVTLAINSILLCKYWCLQKRVIYFVLCGLVLTAQPFTLSMFYFIDMTPEVFLGVTCALTALLLSEDVAGVEGTVAKKIIYSLIAITLVNFSLATYPVLINTIAVAFVGRLLVQSLDWDGSWQKLKSCTRMFIISAINIAIGVASYKLVITYVSPISLDYNTRTLALSQIPERFGVLLKQCIHQLYEYNLPFLPQWILWVFLGFTIILVLYLCSTDNIKQRFVRLTLLFAALFATQTAMVVAAEHMITGRIELFGLVLFEVLMMTIVFTRFGKFRNLWITAGACVVFVSIVNDLDCLRVWKLGFDAEKMLWNRVLTRLETQREFDVGGKYYVVQIGYWISLRSRYYTQTKERVTALVDHGLLDAAFDPPHAPFDAHQFYYPTEFSNKKRYNSGHHARDPEYIECIKRLYEAGVLQKAEVWPKPNGLIVWEDIILFVVDGEELEKCKMQLERELGKK